MIVIMMLDIFTIQLIVYTSNKLIKMQNTKNGLQPLESWKIAELALHARLPFTSPFALPRTGETPTLIKKSTKENQKLKSMLPERNLRWVKRWLSIKNLLSKILKKETLDTSNSRKLKRFTKMAYKLSRKQVSLFKKEKFWA